MPPPPPKWGIATLVLERTISSTERVSGPEKDSLTSKKAMRVMARNHLADTSSLLALKPLKKGTLWTPYFPARLSNVQHLPVNALLVMKRASTHLLSGMENASPGLRCASLRPGRSPMAAECPHRLSIGHCMEGAHNVLVL